MHCAVSSVVVVVRMRWLLTEPSALGREPVPGPGPEPEPAPLADVDGVEDDCESGLRGQLQRLKLSGLQHFLSNPCAKTATNRTLPPS